MIRAIWDDLINDHCVDLAAQMSFYFSLSLFPFFIVTAAFVGWLPSTTMWHNLAQWMTNYLPPQVRTMVFVAILDLTRNSLPFLSVGLVITLWTASSGWVSLMESLTIAYGGQDHRSFWRKRLIAIFATIVGAVFFVLSFSLMTLGHWIAGFISVHTGDIVRFNLPWEFGRWLASVLLMVLGLDLMNYFLPDLSRPWHWMTPGTAFIVVTMVVGSAVFNFYLRHFGSYPRFYGAMAGFIILMTWIYLGSLILLIGAETDGIL
ncbi:MAG TPA: YihY/virulence factor BrkB family protein, partial [Terriglobales bacterium]|nr:YihY/virulence factor BrkB family protein [Terriglobales bacterium]